MLFWVTDLYGKMPRLVDSDGWGLDEITRRVAELYESHATGMPASSHGWPRSTSAVACTARTDETSFQLDFGSFGGRGWGLF